MKSYQDLKICWFCYHALDFFGLNLIFIKMPKKHTIFRWYYWTWTRENNSLWNWLQFHQTIEHWVAKYKICYERITIKEVNYLWILCDKIFIHTGWFFWIYRGNGFYSLFCFLLQMTCDKATNYFIWIEFCAQCLGIFL